MPDDTNTLRALGMGQTRLWGICLAFPEFIAIVFCIFRLVHRYRKSLLWWDDMFAFVTFVVGLPFLATTYIWAIDPPLTPQNRIYISWVLINSSKGIEWFSRISRTLSIARVLSQRDPVFKTLLASVGVMVAFWAGSVMTFALPQRSWQSDRPYLWSADRKSRAFLVMSGMMVDIALAIVPLRLFSNVDLPGFTRRLILASFVMGSIAVPVELALTIHVFLNPNLNPKSLAMAYLLKHLECLCDLLGCNVLVTVPYAFQRWYRDDQDITTATSILSSTPNSTSRLSQSSSSKASSSRTGGSQVLTDVSLRRSEYTTGLSNFSLTSGSLESKDSQLLDTQKSERESIYASDPTLP